MIQTEIQPETVARGKDERSFRRDSEMSLLDILLLTAAKKRFIARFVIGAAILATVVAFLLPVHYEAKIVLLPPSQNSSMGSSLLGQLGGLGSLGSLASLAGGSFKNPTEMYVSLLTSRTVEDSIVYRFELMKEYRKKRVSDARTELEHCTTVVAGSKDGLIRLSVEDRDPKQAAALAAAYVDEFRKLSASLAITEAARRRLFFEQQLDQAKTRLTDAEDAMTKMQQNTGVLQIDSQARALVEAAAVLRGQVVAKEVEIEGMRSFATEDNPNLILAKQELSALQTQLDRVAGSHPDPGSDINLSKGRVTTAGMEYLRRLRELKYQETVFELLAKEFEVAKLDEAREGSIIQVVDAAIPPDKKSSPHRSWIIMGVTVLAMFLAPALVVFRNRFALACDLPENRQRLRTLRMLWKSKQ